MKVKRPRKKDYIITDLNNFGFWFKLEDYIRARKEYERDVRWRWIFRHNKEKKK